jgi:hypothetical protein
MGVHRQSQEGLRTNADSNQTTTVTSDERPCKAFWVMGRKWTNQGEGGTKMLDSFMELKLENERLRQELRVGAEWHCQANIDH